MKEEITAKQEAERALRHLLYAARHANGVDDAIATAQKDRLVDALGAAIKVGEAGGVSPAWRVNKVMVDRDAWEELRAALTEIRGVHHA